MPTLEELRPDIQAGIQPLPKDLETLEASSRDLFTTLSKQIQSVKLKAVATATLVQSLDKVETLPLMFSGILHNYRFGMDRSKQPMHRFDVEVLGTGLWLVSQFTSTELDALIITANPQMDIFDGDAIEGMMVTVRRDAKLGRMIPITFGQTDLRFSPVLLKDKKGIDVRADDLVSIRCSLSAYDRSFTASVVSYDAKTDRLTFRQKGQKNDKTLRVTGLYKFERKGDSLQIISLPLGSDKDGTPIFVGDLVRMYDEYTDGRRLGLLKSEASPGILLVDRTDAGPEYRIAREKIIKLTRISLGFDGVNQSLFSGDRVNLTAESKASGYVVGKTVNGNYEIIRDDGKRSGSSSTFAVSKLFVRKA